MGVKGANLCEMHRLGLPVPPAFIVTAQACLEYKENKAIKKELIDEVRTAVLKLENKTGKKFGGGTVATAERPLLFSIRSSATKDMPEMMQSILNLGMNKRIVQALSQETSNSRWAVQTYIKFLRMFGIQVTGVDPERFNEIVNTVRTRNNLILDSLFTMDNLHEIVDKFQLIANVPEDPWEQLVMALEGAHKAWYSARAIQYRDIHNIEDHGAAVTVQSMVFGNLGVTCGTGVAITRNFTTGQKAFSGLYMANAEVSSHIHFTCHITQPSTICFEYAHWK